MSVKYRKTIKQNKEIIKQNIKTFLIDNFEIENLAVKLKKGFTKAIVVDGTVDSLWKRKLIVELISKIHNPVKIKNRIKVFLKKDYNDNYIKAEIMKAIKSNYYITSNKVKVDVIKGTAIINGKINNWKEYKEAYNCAFYTDNVIDVINNLQKEK